MGLNETPSGERIHIGIFGRRNAGKSSLINALTGQKLAIVSDIMGTTTDPVYKSMELLPLGPVVMIDTPGIDDIGDLGSLRVKKSYQVLNKTDIAILVTGDPALSQEDLILLKKIREKMLPYIIVYNKCDLYDHIPEVRHSNEIYISSESGFHIRQLKELIAAVFQKEEDEFPLISDILSPSDTAVLVVPIDKAAPKGRLILPQQQTIRDILDADGQAVIIKENQLTETLRNLHHPPKVVITDSQVFKTVSAETPPEILLTSFSILMARHKGVLTPAVRGARMIDSLSDGDTVLISEGCTHHRQCGDIGTVKLPAWLKKHTGKDLQFSFTSGTEFPEDLSHCRLVIHCGGCMLNDREMKHRMRSAASQHVPMTNYGTAIAYMNGILERSLEIFPDIKAVLDQ